MYKIAILSGGLATRLLPVTKTIPKALVDVAGKPFIVRQLNYVREQGIEDVVLCIGHLGQMIRDVIGNGKNFGINVTYSEDGKSLIGTGGALVKALPNLGDYFFVLYGDSFLPVNFSEVLKAYKKSMKQALMTVLKNDNQWDTSNVSFNNGHIIEYNKNAPKSNMLHIDYGLSIVASSVFKKYSKKRRFDLANVYQDLSLQGNLAGYEVYERFYEIGSHTGLIETEEYFLKKEKL